ncbi:MAG: esterase/lipase family protein [Nevskiales bacterium]
MSDAITAPSKALLLLEGRAVWELGALYALWPLLRLAPRGDGHPVMVLPGMGAGDFSTRPLRRFLRDRGYRAHGWRAGRNIGSEAIAGRLMHRLRHLRNRYARPVSLIGWSLGGYYARELARRMPDDVRLVITLGTPFAAPAKASNVWALYEYLSGRKAEDDAARLAFLREAPPAPFTSIYSRSDGIVAWQGCLEQPGPRAENIEVRGSHSGLGHNPLALYAIAHRLAQPAGQWTPFERRGITALLYPDPQRS